MNIRLATMLDLEAISLVHYNAVHGTAPSKFYTEEILETWGQSPTDKNRLNRLRARIGSSNEVFVVVELDNKTIIGYGAIALSEHKISSVYVDAMYKHQGVGKKILNYLESLALQHGAKTIQLTAALNAETFYVYHGYSSIELTSYRFQSGVAMSCVKMSKELKTAANEEIST